MDPRVDARRLMTRRTFFSRTSKGIGTAALASLLHGDLFGAEEVRFGRRGIAGGALDETIDVLRLTGFTRVADLGDDSAEHGRIVTVSTYVAAAPTPKHAAYSASKAAVEALTLSVARDLAGTTATSNVVALRAIGSM